MNKRILFILAFLSFAIAFYFALLLWRPTSAHDDPCAFWDTWVGGERFDYQVDSNLNWNLPSDVEQYHGMAFDNGGIETYWSPSQKLQYVMVYRDWIADGQPLGNHHLCVYTRK